ncbi:asparagine synthase (glutamine-hydrolyzing) [Thermodesulfobacteriota bacterium]
MCGIAAILTTNSIPVNIDEIRKMLSTLVHRGPDAWGTYCSKLVALGQTRLSILDLAGGHQPMTTSRYVIVYNGEVYNYIEIRDELEKNGCYFKTTSDTEVVLKAFEIYGTESFSMFNGQFSIIIWDKIEKRIIVARDRYGIRPLYVLKYNGRLYFGSEMKAFDVISGFKRAFHINNLFEHALLWNTLDDRTVYQEIRSVPAGTFEIYAAKGLLHNKQYYQIGQSLGEIPEEFETGLEEFKSLLDDAVRLRLRSDVPVGAYLSGGIDSSVVTHLTSKNNRERFLTYSIRFEDPEFDESDYQIAMNSFIDTENEEVIIDYKKINDNTLDAVYHFERPVFRTAGIPLFLLSRLVRSKDMKVVLTGEGADEILFGYDSYKEIKLLDFWSKYPDSEIRPQLIKRLYPHLLHYKNKKQFGLLRIYYKSFLKNYNNKLVSLNIRVHNNKVIKNCFSKEHKISLDENEILEEVTSILPDNYNSWTLLQQNQYLEMKTLLSGYLLSSQGDRMSMAHSVEGRYPFLDHRLVEKLFYFKDSYKLNGFSQKYLLCEAFKKHIPEKIIHRPKKPYTAPDLKSYLPYGKLTEEAKYFLSEKQIKKTGIYDYRYVGQIIKKYKDRLPEQIGYRDNMLITFILTTQMAQYWIDNPKSDKLYEKLRTVEIVE